MSMKMRTLLPLAALVAAVVALTFTWSVIAADPEKEGQAVTLRGKIVDLHSFMTGQHASADRAKSAADCIRAGVPCALETTTGLYLLSQGTKGAATLLAPFAEQEVEVRGKMYEKKGIKYIDVSTATRPATAQPPPGANR
jgi:hypothetical protein